MTVGSLTALLALGLAQAGGGFEARVEPAKVRVGERFTVIVEIGDASLRDIDLPPVEGAEQVSSLVFRDQHIITQGQATRSRTFQVAFRATKAGRVTVPPITFTANGRSAQTNAVSVTVRERPAGSRRELTWDDVAFLESHASAREVFAGEGVRLELEHWKLRSPHISVTQAGRQGVEWPPTEGFVTVPDAPAERGIRIEERNGAAYEVTSFVQYLYPPQPGAYEIGSWRWLGQGRQRGSLGTHRFELSTEPVTVRVKPLPEAPPGFTGTVGSFEFDSRLAADKLFQGASAQLVIAMRGHGNPRGIAAPQLEAPPGLRLSAPTADTNQLGQGSDFKLEKRFTYTLVPTVAGKLRIPAARYVYFDTETGAYRTARLGPFPLEAEPAPVGTQSALAATAGEEAAGVRILHRGIRPPLLATPELERDGAPGLTTAAAFTAPPALYAVAALLISRRRRFATDSAYARSHHARRRALKTLASAPSAEEPAQAIGRALTGYAADKLDAPAAGLTSREVRDMLAKANANPQLIETYLRILEACERARYASSELNRQEVQALVEAAHGAVDQLEGQLGKETRA